MVYPEPWLDLYVLWKFGENLIKSDLGEKWRFIFYLLSSYPAKVSHKIFESKSLILSSWFNNDHGLETTRLCVDFIKWKRAHYRFHFISCLQKKIKKEVVTVNVHNIFASLFSSLSHIYRLSSVSFCTALNKKNMYNL